MKYTLTISPEYQSEWGLRQMFREFVANALDAQTRGEGTAEVLYERGRGKGAGTVVITTTRVSLTLDKILMGVSGSRSREDCIGTFGEGLTLSLIVAARLQSMHPVRIINGTESWTPAIEFSPEFGAQVVTLTTRALRSDHQRFEVQIANVLPEVWEDLRSTFLALDPRFDNRETVKPYHHIYDRLLMQPEYKGRLYVKGVYIKTHPQLEYGWDLDMPLNRDRDMVDEWDLKHKLGQLLARCFANEPTKFGHVLDLLERGEALEVGSTAIAYNEPVAEALTSQFLARHGENAMPVLSSEAADSVRAQGGAAVVVNPVVARILETKLGTTETRLASRKFEVSRVYTLGDLESGEQVVLGGVLRMLRQAGYETTTLAVVDFADPTVLGRWGSDGGVRVSRRVLASFSETLRTVIHEVTHAAGKDGSEAHHVAMEDAYLRIIGSLLPV